MLPVLGYHRDRNYRSGVASFSKNLPSASHLLFQQRLHLGRRYVTLVKQSRCVHVTVGRLTHCSQGRAATGAFATQTYRRHLHVQTSHLCTRHVERRVAVGSVTLDACPGTATSTDAARQASASRRNSLQPVDWL